MQKEIPIKDAINLAVQAYNIIGSYRKENTWEYVKTENGSLESVTAKSNKQMMKDFYDTGDFFIDGSCQDITEDIYNHYQGLIFKVLSDSSNDFTDRIYQIITKDTVTRKDLGFIAPLPSLYEQEIQRELFVKEISDSKHIATKGAKVSVRALLHEARYIRTRDFHVYTFISDGNLITHFSSKHPTDWKVDKLVEGNEYNLDFKVKNHNQSKWYDCKETLVNYLKISD